MWPCITSSGSSSGGTRSKISTAYCAITPPSSVSNTPATQSLHARSLCAWSTPSANRWCAIACGPAPSVAPVQAVERVGAADAEERAGGEVDDAVDRVQPRGRQAHAVAGHDVVRDPERAAQGVEAALRGGSPARRR